MTTASDIAKALDPKFKKSGDGFSCKCPVHDDGTASLKVSDGKDGRILVHCHAGCDGKDVIDELKDRGLWPKQERAERPAPKAAPKPKARPKSDEFGEIEKKPKGEKSRTVATYDYFNHITGELMMQVLRKEPKGFSQRRPDPSAPSGFVFTVPDEYRTLYNAIRVFNHDKTVFVVEGEKDVDNLASIGVVATCNPGGAGKWDDRYSEILRGKDVILVPDVDPQMVKKSTGELQWHADGRPKHAGQDHADLVGERLQGIAKRVRILHLPGLGEKGDVSDWLAIEGNDRKKLGELCKEAKDWAPPVTPEREPEPEPEPELVDEQPKPKKAAPRRKDNGAPFTPLGYNKGKYYYMPNGTQQIVDLSPSAHTKGNLLGLAPHIYWTTNYGATRGGFDHELAADDMMRACEARGIFSPEMMRGRGAWFDDGRIVLHCGDRVYVDRTPHAPSTVSSRYVYEVGRPMRADIDHPLDLAGATKFLDLVKMMPWMRPIDALYAAGWCALAHIGGVLDWRPHIWVIGAKGSGKSHVMSKVIQPILGEANVSNLFVAGESTEAGIRQDLGCDAIPVLFDEAEGEDQKSHDRLQRILALVRQSSSETGAKMVKGSATGSAMSFQIRSCFAFSSINASLVQQSDRSRVAIIELSEEKQKKAGQPGCFEDILAAETALMTKEFISQFHARAIAQAATIRENARVFTSVVAAVMNEQRAGDQLGTLLAGAYSLQSDQPATFEQAKAFIAQHDWTDDKDEVEGMSDERNCLQHIFQSRQRVTIAGQAQELTIGELFTIVADTTAPDHEEKVDDAHRALNRVGIKLTPAMGCYYIANRSAGLASVLKGTPWATNWNAVLKRLPGADKTGTIYFGFRESESRATKLPLSSMKR